jgi:hypothetical protein
MEPTRPAESAAAKATTENIAIGQCHDSVVIACFCALPTVVGMRTLLKRTLLKQMLNHAGWRRPMVTVGVLSRSLYAQDADPEMLSLVPPTSFEVDPYVMVEFLEGRVDCLVLVNLEPLR